LVLPTGFGYSYDLPFRGEFRVGPTEILVGGGVAALLAAVAGGGLKAFGVEVPALASVRRQVLLAIAGLALVTVGLLPKNPLDTEPQVAEPPVVTASAASPASPVPESARAPQASARPDVPNIVDLPFPAARQFLIQNSWAPIYRGSPMANQDLGFRVQEIFDTGFGEAVSCSGSSLAPCLFRYRNPGGYVLEVVTNGEQLTSAVVTSATVVDCTVQPKPEAC
jgi:hypothetical protein